MGKTYAAWLGPLLLGPDGAADAPPPLTVLWLTPLRALAADTGLALGRAAAALKPHWTVDVRTGDTPASARARQDRRLPTALVTTPESLTLLLSRADWRERFAHLAAVVVDEWHELMASKRGVQVELALARLRACTRRFRTWGLSATLANLDEALECLLGVRAAAAASCAASTRRRSRSTTARPATIERFPWAGHIGLKLLPAGRSARSTARARRSSSPTCARPRRSGTRRSSRRAPTGPAASRSITARSSARCATGSRMACARNALRAVVCTSSLDLGVDFAPVDQVLQIGSPKGVARLLQRAGRSGHRPGAMSQGHRRADAGAGARRSSGSARRRRRARDRAAHAGTWAARRARCSTSSPARSAAASGRRSCWREIRGTHAYAHLTRRRVAMGARLRRPRRREPERISRSIGAS